MNASEQLIANITNFIIQPLIVFLFGLALIAFLWGVAEYLWQSDSEAGRATGAQHMIWGIFGMFIMFAAFAIIRIIANTVGFEGSLPPGI